MPFMQIPNTFSVFPVSGKRPLVKWEEYQHRLPTKEEREKWKGQQLGIVTGSISNILVLDDDGGLDLEKYPIPKTWTQKTPRGGTHYFFKWRDSLTDRITTRTEILPKVDVRGSGGFVVFYGWEKPTYLQHLQSPPQWLIDLLPNKRNPLPNNTTETKQVLGNETKSHIQELLDGIKPGNRNDSFTRVAGSFRGRGYSSDDIFGILSPKAREVGFGLGELKVICDSVARYTPNIEIVGTSTFSEVVAEEIKTEWLISPKLISKQSITFIAGLPEAKKTWILMDLALALAAGSKWLNKFDCKKSRVIYMDQERPKASTIERFKALVSGRGLNNTDLDENLLLIPQSRVRVNLPQSFQHFDRVVGEFKPDLILIDSFKKIHTSNEIVSQDVQAVFTRLEELKDKHGCGFVFIHHEPKGVISKRQESFDVQATDAAGTIDLQQTADHFFNVVCIHDESTIYHTKNNHGDKVPPSLVKVIDMNEDKTKIKVEAY